MTKDTKIESLINIDLKEIDIVFGQSHVRMGLISNLTNVSIAFSSAIIAALASLQPQMASAWLLALSIPSFVFAFLILREDLLMAHHDRYFYSLRNRLLHSLGLAGSEPYLRFLPEIKCAKVGGVFSIPLSVLRYLPPFLIVPSIFIWVSSKESVDITNDVLSMAILVCNLILGGLLLFGIYRLGRVHSDNDKLILADPDEVDGGTEA